MRSQRGLSREPSEVKGLPNEVGDHRKIAQDGCVGCRVGCLQMWEGETVESSRPPDNLIKIKRSTHLGGDGWSRLWSTDSTLICMR